MPPSGLVSFPPYQPSEIHQQTGKQRWREVQAAFLKSGEHTLAGVSELLDLVNFAG